MRFAKLRHEISALVENVATTLKATGSAEPTPLRFGAHGSIVMIHIDKNDFCHPLVFHRKMTIRGELVKESIMSDRRGLAR